MKQNDKIARTRGWKRVSDSGWSPTELADAQRYTVEYKGQRGPSDIIDCGTSQHLSQMVTGALRRAYEAGAEDKLAELRAFIGVNK